MCVKDHAVQHVQVHAPRPTISLISGQTSASCIRRNHHAQSRPVRHGQRCGDDALTGADRSDALGYSMPGRAAGVVPQSGQPLCKLLAIAS
jgi:hypothetical protein